MISQVIGFSFFVKSCLDVILTNQQSWQKKDFLNTREAHNKVIHEEFRLNGTTKMGFITVFCVMLFSP